MSNPLSSLKKSHKPPLFSNMGKISGEDDIRRRPVPFRNPNYTDDEGKLLEEITGGMASSRIKTRDPFIGGLPKIPDASLKGSNGFGMSQGGTPRTGDSDEFDLSDEGQIPGDHELMSTMITRITQLEAKLAYQSKELNEKDRKVQILTDKVHLLQKSQDSTTPSHTAELENKCYLLQQQIHDMEEFLADYGMVWLGEKLDEETDSYNDDIDDDMWRQASSVSQHPSFKVDYNKMLENIQDLNVLAGDGVASVTKTKDGARLKMQDAVQLTLYANGILMFNGPFRPFTDSATQAFVKDILDGYFPGELQNRFPEGVPFAVTDRREVYHEDKRTEIFAGSGQTLGGETKPSRLVPSKLQDKTTDSSTSTSQAEGDNRVTTNELPGPQMSVEQFLQKLPRSVVKSGKVIDIRNTLGETLQSAGKRKQGDVTLIETECALEMKLRLQDSSRPYTARDITTLRVKSEDGNHTYILKMRFTETIGDLKKYIMQHRKSNTGLFDVVTAYPNKVHSDVNMTLLDAGLTPNAVAHLRIKTS